MYGSPLFWFIGNPLTHFIPVDFMAGIYAGIAWMKISVSPR
jgi:hypothetical protein